jgi:hypothetical protein
MKKAISMTMLNICIMLLCYIYHQYLNFISTRIVVAVKNLALFPQRGYRAIEVLLGEVVCRTSRLLSKAPKRGTHKVLAVQSSVWRLLNY